MSLYNIVHGFNQLAPELLKILGLCPNADIPRFRDCYLNEDGTEIILLTRTGGGNRDDYAGSNKALQDHPLYLRDHDDDFDQTYALFYFKVPENLLEITMPGAPGKVLGLKEKFETVFGKIEE